MDGFDTMSMPPFLSSPLALNSSHFAPDYLQTAAATGLSPIDLPPHAQNPFDDALISEDVSFSQPMSEQAVRRVSGSQFGDPFTELVAAFDPFMEGQHSQQMNANPLQLLPPPPPPSHQHQQQQQQHQQHQPPPPDASIDHNNKLLCFSPPMYHFTLLDYSLRRTSISLSAQLHGMFFLAESPYPALASPNSTADASGGGSAVAELTCYRRNLFQITGSVTLPRTLRYIMTEQGDRIPILAQELTVSATESVEGNAVKIISVPWKTASTNTGNGIGSGTGTVPGTEKTEKEPAAFPLDTMGGQDLDSEYATFPIAWKRLQFRIATANNGRRRELQQHFVVRLRVVATLSTGARIGIAEAHSGPVIVRGRSPRNFQSRRDMPLGGSSVRKSSKRSKSPVPSSTVTVPVPLSDSAEKRRRLSSTATTLTKDLLTKDALPLSLDEEDEPMCTPAKPAATPYLGEPQLSPTAAPSAGPLYEYFPLGLDEWQEPVDAVYRPHVVHHLSASHRDGLRHRGYFAR